MKRILILVLLLVIAGCSAGQAVYPGRCAEYARLCHAGYAEYCDLYMNCIGPSSKVLLLVSEDSNSVVVDIVQDYLYSVLDPVLIDSVQESDVDVHFLWNYDLIVRIPDSKVELFVRDGAPVEVIALSKMISLELEAFAGIKPSQKLLSSVQSL